MESTERACSEENSRKTLRRDRFAHLTGHSHINVSVPAGASVADKIGGLFESLRVVCVDRCQAGETSVPAVRSPATKCNFSMSTFYHSS